METMKFLMTDLGEATAACVSALESRGLEVTVCPRDGAQVLEKLLECRPRAVPVSYTHLTLPTNSRV